MLGPVIVISAEAPQFTCSTSTKVQILMLGPVIVISTEAPRLSSNLELEFVERLLRQRVSREPEQPQEEAPRCKEEKKKIVSREPEQPQALRKEEKKNSSAENPSSRRRRRRAR